MPPELPALYDLQLTIDGPVNNLYKVRCRLLEHAIYPPPPRLEQGRIVFDDDFKEIADNETTVAADQLHDYLMLDKPLQFDPFNPPQNLQPRLVKATRSLLQGEGMEMLQFMLERATPLAANPHAQPTRLARLTLDIESLGLRKAPWEFLGQLQGPGWIEIGSLMILRRHRSRAGEHSGSLDLPVNVAIKSYTNLVAPQHAFQGSDSMFDPFTMDARTMGGIVWGELGDETKPGEVHHLIFDPNESRSWMDLASDIDEMGPFKDPILKRGAGMSVPRLLVLHAINAPVPYRSLQPYVDLALDRGADAVLLATLPSSKPDAGEFFSTFYRKLMHNWPLDQCVLAARLVARNNNNSVGTVFGARAEGELGLLLSRAIIEPVRLKAKSRSKRPLEEHPAKKKTRGGRSISSSLAGRTRGAVEAERDLAGETSAKVRDLAFDQELHGVEQAVRMRDSMRRAARMVESADKVAAEIDEAPAEDTVRLTNLWLTTGKKQKQRPVDRNEALTVGGKYDLHLQIGQRRVEALVAEAFPDEKLKEIFKTHKSVTLDVMFFTPQTDFKLKSRQAQIELPRFGNSDELAVPIVPLLAGARRIRACLYYQNTMLQSVILETTVVEAGDATHRSENIAATSAVIDYLALTDLTAEGKLPSPAVNLFTNESPDGTHWIGIFSSGGTSGINLRSGNMHTFSSAKLSTVSKKMRDRLLQIEGDNREGFRYSLLDPEENEIEQREKDLCAIALEGWELFHTLFQGAEQPLALNRLKTFKKELTNQGSIVSVARCRSEGITIPWAALYTLPLDTDKADQMSLCGLFKEQLAAKHDLLDNPVACREQPDCPLDNKQIRRKTICPFGFWGFLHQIEQPLQQVTPTPSDETPPEISAPKMQTSFLSRSSDEDLKLVCGVYSDLPGADEHREEIKNIKIKSLKVDDTADRDRVLQLLEEGGQHVYYFYCHGEMENSKFRLKLGVGDDPHYLGAADFDLTEIEWPDQPMPLVFINGCETMAVLPEQIHDFLSVLKQLGASGVIGTEVKIWTDLARPFGNLVLTNILNGKSVGEAFLEIRKDMLRRYNPLGLLYSYYSRANLHLHDPDDCNWCATHKRADAGGGQD